MKLFIVLSLLAYGYADKLDRTYLPPANAGSAGGSPGSLVAPRQESNFSQQANQGFHGSQPFLGPFDQQPTQVSGSPDFTQSIPSPDPGFYQPAKPGNGLKGPGVRFSRPYGPSGDQATPHAPTLTQPLGSGVQPPSDSFDPFLFDEPVFSEPGQKNKVLTGPKVQPKQPKSTGLPAASEASADIFRYDNHIDGGSFSYDFETSNGILVEESGEASDGVQAHGEYAYTGDNGQFYRITYTADQNGYLPHGDHLPTPPPIPQEILRSIEKNAKAAAAGTQEGAYNPDDDSPQVFNGAYIPGQILLGSNGFDASSSRFQPKSQTPSSQGSNKGPNQKAQGYQQGFSGSNRQGQNGSQSQGHVGYDYSRPVHQGIKASGNANITPSGSTKTLGSQNKSRPFQGKIHTTGTGVFDQSTSNEEQYQSQAFNLPQKPPSRNHGLVIAGKNSNRGSQGPTQLIKQSGNRQPISSFNQNRRFGSTGSQTKQGISSFGQNHPSHKQNQPQQDFQGQLGAQASQGQRGQSGVRNQSGYEYNKPQPSFNSGNQGQFRPLSQGQTRPSSQTSFTVPQIKNGFPESTESRPGSDQGPYPNSNRTTRPQGSQGQQQEFSGSGSKTQKDTSLLFEPEEKRLTSLKLKMPLNQTVQRQESFIGPNQQASFSSEEGYVY